MLCPNQGFCIEVLKAAPQRTPSFRCPEEVTSLGSRGKSQQGWLVDLPPFSADTVSLLLSQVSSRSGGQEEPASCAQATLHTPSQCPWAML